MSLGKALSIKVFVSGRQDWNGLDWIGEIEDFWRKIEKRDKTNSEDYENAFTLSVFDLVHGGGEAVSEKDKVTIQILLSIYTCIFISLELSLPLSYSIYL